MIADLIAPTVVETVDFFSSKDLKWWFAGLFLLLVASAYFLIKVLLKYHADNITAMQTQLSEQRVSNQAISSQLLAYVTTDHQQSIHAQQTTAAALKDLSDAIRNFPSAKQP